MRRSKKGSKIKSRYLAFVLILVMVLIVIAVVAVMVRPSTPKVSEYLQVTHAGSIGKYQASNLIEITYLGLRITAVGGDAHSIVVQVDEGMQLYQENDVYPVILKGEYLDAVIQLEGCTVPIVAGKCTVHIDIGCSEAPGPETIAITLLEEDIAAAPLQP